MNHNIFYYTTFHTRKQYFLQKHLKNNEIHCMIFLDIVREVVWLIWVVFLLRAEWTMSKKVATRPTELKSRCCRWKPYGENNRSYLKYLIFLNFARAILDSSQKTSIAVRRSTLYSIIDIIKPNKGCRFLRMTILMKNLIHIINLQWKVIGWMFKK